VPAKWLAPESIFDSKYSSASDVWSFGIVCWELYTFGQDPYPDMDIDEFIKAIIDNYRMPCPRYCPPDVYVKIVC
jgi:serine/threonine protein kinase